MDIYVYYCPWHLRNTQFQTFYYIHVVEIPTNKGANSYKKNKIFRKQGISYRSQTKTICIILKKLPQNLQKRNKYAPSVSVRCKVTIRVIKEWQQNNNHGNSASIFMMTTTKLIILKWTTMKMLIAQITYDTALNKAPSIDSKELVIRQLFIGEELWFCSNWWWWWWWQQQQWW